MPSARAEDFRRVVERWTHQDGRAVTIPIHGGSEIGPPLFHKILAQLGVSADEFRKLQ